MSAIFADASFEDKLKTTFRGSAKEQKVAIDEAQKERIRKLRQARPLAPLATALGLSAKPALGAGSSVFKSNLGGTLGSTR